ncbi:MAG: hypothetical protein SH847_09265 [Roseiflexaceae bacterium]|nr:hypothetical protein [Roseiflexaceae bacterium]
MSRTPAGASHESPPSAPRWVQAFGTVLIVLVVLIIILHLTGNSLGGPGSHTLPIPHGAQQP